MAAAAVLGWLLGSARCVEAEAAEAAEAPEEAAAEPAEEEAAAAEVEAAPEEEAEEKRPVEIKTSPFDPRFPTMNQAKNCFTRYNEFHKCAKEKDAEDPLCKKYASFYRSVCPTDWVNKWNEERENGNYAGRY